MLDLQHVPTHELVKELSKREGVKKLIAEPYQKYSVDCTVEGTNDTGPAVILVVTD